MGNEIHLDNVYIGAAVTLMEDLERRVENFHKQKTYDEILSEARDGLKKILPPLTENFRREKILPLTSEERLKKFLSADKFSKGEFLWATRFTWTTFTSARQ